jgi:hypothetical protein
VSISGFALLAALALMFLGASVWSRRQRARALAALRSAWGRPVDRVRHMDAIAAYHHTRAAHAAPHQGPVSVDDRTWTDLHLDEVFARIDRTHSSPGQQALYHRLRSSPSADHLAAFDALVSRLGADPDARERAQVVLGRLQDPGGYDLWWLAQPDALDTRPWHIVFPLIAATMVAAMLFVPFWRGALLIVIVGGACNLVVRIATAHRVGTLVRAFRQVGPLIAAAETLQFLSDPAVDPLVGALRVETAGLGRLRAISGWVGRDVVAGDPLIGLLFEYLNLMFLLDANALYFGAREVRRRGAALLRVIHAVGEIDAAIAVASFRAGAAGWVRPRFTPPGAPALLSGVRHPLVADAVPNSIRLDPGRGVLVTGSNMSGKSTFVRTAGVTAVLAQTIHTCLAEAYEAPVFTVRSCMGGGDDLLAGKSYYIVEVETVLSLVAAGRADVPHLFLLDELFRGTNAVERIAAAEAALAELVESATGARPHVVLAATHDGELVHLLRASYETVHFADSVGADGLVFDYRLQPGPASTRNAIALLRLHGAPSALVSRALARAALLEDEREVRVTGSS